MCYVVMRACAAMLQGTASTDQGLVTNLRPELHCCIDGDIDCGLLCMALS